MLNILKMLENEEEAIQFLHKHGFLKDRGCDKCGRKMKVNVVKNVLK